MNWEWLVSEGLIEGDPAYYADGDAAPEEVSNAVRTAYLAADEAQRKTLVDNLWSTGAFKGDKAYWYEDRSGEVENLATAAASIGGLGAEGADKSIPGGSELWKVGGEDWLVYTVPDTDPPVYMAWKSPSDKDTQSFFGPGQAIVYQNEVDSWDGVDVIDFGSTDDLANFDDNPFDSWSSDLEQIAKTQPWVMDDDYQRLAAQATLEGRPLRQDEIQTTNWWTSNTEAQRDWMKVNHSDPLEAQRMVDDNRLSAQQSILDSGLQGASQEMIDYMADQVTEGNWSSTYFQTQIGAISDPGSSYELDEGMKQFQSGLTTTIEYEDTVQELSDRWLGPAMGNMTPSEVSKWASVLRNDPNGEQRFVESLQGQRLALFPEYEDRTLTYDDIASPWRNYGAQQWGQTMDESSDIFQQMILNNDASLKGQLLRSEGMTQGIGKVVQDANSALLSGAGGTVRRPV